MDTSCSDLRSLGGHCVAGAQAQAPLQKIRVTIPVPVLPFYPLYVARDHGEFAKHGLDVEIITTSATVPMSMR